MRRARFESDFELAVLETHQPDIALERALDGDVALLRGERDEVLEAGAAPARRVRRCAGHSCAPPSAAGAAGAAGAADASAPRVAPRGSERDGICERAGISARAIPPPYPPPLAGEGRALARLREEGGGAAAPAPLPRAVSASERMTSSGVGKSAA